MILLTTENDKMLGKSSEEEEAEGEGEGVNEKRHSSSRAGSGKSRGAEADTYEHKYLRTVVGEFEFDLFRMSNFSKLKRNH